MLHERRICHKNQISCYFSAGADVFFETTCLNASVQQIKKIHFNKDNVVTFKGHLAPRNDSYVLHPGCIFCAIFLNS